MSHTLIALPFAATRSILAIRQTPEALSISLATKVLLCMVFARSAAMSFNRWADRNIDAQNPRTAIREIPSGLIASNAALTFCILNCIAFVITTWFINPLCFYLSFVALAVVLGYSYTKRFTSLCHLVLGLGLGLAPVGAWLAVTGSFHPAALYLAAAVLCWVGGFDVIYALQDSEFDRNNGLHSLPSRLGNRKALGISRSLHIASSLFLLSAGLQAGLGWVYYLGCGVFILLLISQHRLVKPNDLSKVNMAFFTFNGLASILFFLFTLLDVVL
ncbi:MAG: UbiA-like polyprenyltransferase [Bacteroidota bacterium]